MYSWCTCAVLGLDLNSTYEALGFFNKSIFLNRIRLNFGRMEKPESGIRNRSRKRKRTRNPNLRNKTWRRFCLKSVTNNYCSKTRLFIPILYLFIVIIFFTVAFFAYGAKFFFENFIYAWALQLGIMIDMSTPPPFAAFSSQWMKHGALLRNE